MLEMSK